MQSYSLWKIGFKDRRTSCACCEWIGYEWTQHRSNTEDTGKGIKLINGFDSEKGWKGYKERKGNIIQELGRIMQTNGHTHTTRHNHLHANIDKRFGSIVELDTELSKHLSTGLPRHNVHCSPVSSRRTFQLAESVCVVYRLDSFLDLELFLFFKRLNCNVIDNDKECAPSIIADFDILL